MASQAPKLYLRQCCVNDLTSSWKPGHFLEIGAGVGLMTKMFLEKNYHGHCQDISPESREFLKSNLDSFGSAIQVIEKFSLLQYASFDYLLAFEVLEHIEDDLSALNEWSLFLKEEGKLIVSVPAHQKKFSKVDEYVGHVRRYEKIELENLLKDSGYKNIQIVNYGFPITEISRKISNILMAKDKTIDELSIKERNLKSSYSRLKIISKYISYLNEDLYLPSKYLQRIFYRVDWGDGFVAIADKI